MGSPAALAGLRLLDPRDALSHPRSWDWMTSAWQDCCGAEGNVLLMKCSTTTRNALMAGEGLEESKKLRCASLWGWTGGAWREVQEGSSLCCWWAGGASSQLLPLEGACAAAPPLGGAEAGSAAGAGRSGLAPRGPLPAEERRRLQGPGRAWGGELCEEGLEGGWSSEGPQGPGAGTLGRSALAFSLTRLRPEARASRVPFCREASRCDSRVPQRMSEPWECPWAAGASVTGHVMTSGRPEAAESRSLRADAARLGP